VVLLIAAALAMIWANARPQDFADVWGFTLGTDRGPFHLDLSLKEWINDLLMALFFFVVGTEIKREVLSGELSNRRAAALPVAAAVGGMLLPAAIYIAFNAGRDGADGWGIPIATDIAFAIGALSLLGRRVPASLKAFLLALAIVDDIGGIIVIAVFYTDHLAPGWLLAGAGVIGAGAVAAVLGIRSAWVYLAVAGAAWLFFHESGVHATIAGVLVALIVPVRYGTHASPSSLLDQAEHLLHPLSSYLVVPLFALANAGIEITSGLVEDSLSSPVAAGVVLGLVLGKPLGIVLCSLAAIRAGIAEVPRGVGWDELAGVGLLGGIGFVLRLVSGRREISES
jgi:NhaA family Na+:H+ antiporter